MTLVEVQNGENNKTVEQWGILELSLSGPSAGNPFIDIQLSAEFKNGNEKVKVDGFYDGDGIYKVRFMPHAIGEWNYETTSNDGQLSNNSGSFSCITPTGNNHGPVEVKDRYNFAYADGTPYYPFGTTCYAWTHQGEGLETKTLETLSAAPFNKIRMCVFPKRYNYNANEPDFYPFELLSKKETSDGKGMFEWDFTRFSPDFFRHLEKRILDLMKLDIEADLILFHPYDEGHWGFDRMPHETDIFYLKYIVARLSSFRNIWWSLANEYDFMEEKKYEAWGDFIQTIADNDPYKRLCSIHNGNIEYYDIWNPNLTHGSVQNTSLVEGFGRAVTLRDAYKKPIVYDEVGYEGDFPERWGDLSAEEMVHRYWQATIAGTYLTHGETYLNKDDIVWWARGGVLHGKSPERIAFLRKILEETGYLEMLDKWKNHQTATTPEYGYLLIYFGKEIKKEWAFSIPCRPNKVIPDGVKFTVEIIDTWDMTITPVDGEFETLKKERYQSHDKDNKKIRLPERPYLAMRLKRVE